MAFFRNLSGGLRSLFLKESVEHELDEELRDFVESECGREDAHRNEPRAGSS